MATPIGTNVVTSISRRHIIPQIVDTVYGDNVVTFRFLQRNKKIVSGATHIENPFHYQGFSNGGVYRGYDVLDVSPNDTVKTGAWDWKQHYVPVTVDGLTLAKTDSPEAIANFLKTQFEIARMEAIENLAVGIWSDVASDPDQIDGLEGAVDAGSVAATYAGLTRASNTWLNSQVDSSTSTLSEAALQSMHGDVGVGGRQATLIASRQDQYNRYVALLQGDKRFVYQPGGSDVALADAGFSNVLFNGTPWVADEHVPDGPNSSNSAIYFLNEDYLELHVKSGKDFYLNDFIQPANQDAMTSLLLWMGNLICTNPQRQGKMTNVSA